MDGQEPGRGEVTSKCLVRTKSETSANPSSRSKLSIEGLNFFNSGVIEFNNYLTVMNAAGERKADTRRKIQLGGLIVKAGLATEEPSVLLGMLTAGARVLRGPSALDSRRRWKEIGDRAFGSNPSQ